MRAQSREKILGAALEVFVERGYHEGSIAEITKRAGVSRGLVTYYFESKRKLVEELLGRWMADREAHLDVEGTPDERLAGLIDNAVAAMGRGIDLHRMGTTLLLQPSARPIFDDLMARHGEHVMQSIGRIRELFAARGADDPVMEEIMLRTVLQGIRVSMAINPDTYPLEQARLRVYAMYGLPAQPGPAPTAVDADTAQLS